MGSHRHSLETASSQQRPGVATSPNASSFCSCPQARCPFSWSSRHCRGHPGLTPACPYPRPGSLAAMVLKLDDPFANCLSFLHKNERQGLHPGYSIVVRRSSSFILPSLSRISSTHLAVIKLLSC